MSNNITEADFENLKRLVGMFDPLTKREQFAMYAMQAILPPDGKVRNASVIIKNAVIMADLLIEELEKSE